MNSSSGSGQVADDDDAATDGQIELDYRTWSKGYLRRQKLLSMIRGNTVPSRRKVFSEIHIDEDLKIFEVSIAGRTIKCAKIYNPAVLDVKKHRFSLGRNNGEQADEDYWNHLTNIQRLEIEDHEGIMQTFPKQLANSLPLLESLSLSWTRVRTIPEKFYQLSSLKTLYLERNQIKSLNGIEQAENLTRLNVSHNCIDSLPKSFGQNITNLVDVNLSGNQLRELPESIGSLVRLKTLDVSSNKLQALPLSIGHVIELSSLDVSNNQLTELPPSIVHLPNLEDFRARGNRLSVLPTGFGQLTRIASVLLRANRFTAVPGELADLSNLQNLNMSDNQIELMGRSIVSLKFLVLDNNRLTSIDDVITGCVNLQLLSVKQNRLTSVSANISRIHGLRSLQLSGNSELSSVPSSLSNLESLSNIGLRATRLSTIPFDVVMMPSLTSLDLDDCRRLDKYLLLAYKQQGLEGVRAHIRDGNASEPPATDAVQNANGSASVPIANGNSTTGAPEMRSNSRAITGLNASRMTLAPIDEDGHGSDGKSRPLDMSRIARTTMIPEEFRDPEVSSSSLGYRQQQGLSIVLGQTTPSDLYNDESRPGNGNVTGKAVNAKPSTAAKPAITMNNRQTLHPVGDVVKQREDGDEIELVPVGGNVVRVIPNFGDLLSSSIDEHPSSAGNSDSNAEGTNSSLAEDEKDFSELYATVTRKNNKPPTVAPKPRTQEKAAVRFNLD